MLSIFIELSHFRQNLCFPSPAPGWHCDDSLLSREGAGSQLGTSFCLSLTVTAIDNRAKQVMYGISFNPYNSMKVGIFIFFSHGRKLRPRNGP